MNIKLFAQLCSFDSIVCKMTNTVSGVSLSYLTAGEDTERLVSCHAGVLQLFWSQIFTSGFHRELSLQITDRHRSRI